MSPVIKRLSVVLLLSALIVIIYVFAAPESEPAAGTVAEPSTSSAASASAASAAPTAAPSPNYTELVHGLDLRVVFMDSLLEMYQVNVVPTEAFSEESYRSIGGEDSLKHHRWVTKTYESFDEKMKSTLRTLFEQENSNMMNPVALPIRLLKEDAPIGDIVKVVIYQYKDEQRGEISVFLNKYYDDFFKAYLDENKPEFDRRAETFNQALAVKDDDLVGFMEKISGMHFPSELKPVFYFTLKPVGAWGSSSTKGETVSTLQRTYKNPDKLFYTPFHEYSHLLIQQFTRADRFVGVAEQMKQNKELESLWKSTGMDKVYDWIGFCEENLVEGFAKYLTFKYDGSRPAKPLYLLDLEFFNYLDKMGFDGQQQTLEEASKAFLLSHSGGNPS